MITLSLDITWNPNDFNPYVNGNHHSFELTPTAQINDNGNILNVDANDLWTGRTFGLSSDPIPPNGMWFVKMAASSGKVFHWFMVHNKYSFYAAVFYSGVWYFAKKDVDLDAIPPQTLTMSKTPIVQQAGSTVYVKAPPNTVINLYKALQMNDAGMPASDSLPFSTGGRNYDRYLLYDRFSNTPVQTKTVGSTGVGTFFGVADGDWVVGGVEPSRSGSFMMNKFTVASGICTAAERQISCYYTPTGSTRTNSTTGKKQRQYTIIAKYTLVTAPGVAEQAVPFVSGNSPIKISLGNNGDYVPINTFDGWFNEGLVGFYIQDSQGSTPPGGEGGTYWTDWLDVPVTAPSAPAYHDFTSLQDAINRKDTVIKNTETVYCSGSGEFNVGDKCYQSSVIGECNVTTDGIRYSNLYQKAYTISGGGGIITSILNVDGSTGEVPQNTDASSYWGGTRTNQDRGLIKDNRFTPAQYEYNSAGAIINTNIDIDVQKLKDGFLHDNNWNNLKGKSYKKWKTVGDYEDIPLQNVPIPVEFSGKQTSVTVCYFNGSGIIVEQFQEFIQL